CGLASRLKYSSWSLSSPVSNAAAKRFRLPAVFATISNCSGPARLNRRALSVPSMIAPRPVSGTGSSWISTSPMSTRRSTNRRSRNLSRSTLRLDIPGAPLVVSLWKHFARRVDHRVDAAGELDRAGDIHVQGGARVILATDASRPRCPHDLLAQRIDRGVELGGGHDLAHDA